MESSILLRPYSSHSLALLSTPLPHQCKISKKNLKLKSENLSVKASASGGDSVVTLLDYGAGNVRSVRNAIRVLGHEIKDVQTPEDILNADRLIFPGVGAFAVAMDFLNQNGMAEALCKYIENDRPFLGICLGLQLLSDSSEEKGPVQGLGLIPGVVGRFDSSRGYRVPHIGWHALQIKKDSEILDDVGGQHVYFVHSYRAMPSNANKEWISSTCNYGNDFIASIRRGNVHAVQFHPEKSGDVGLSILKRFLHSNSSIAKRPTRGNTSKTCQKSPFNFQAAKTHGGLPQLQLNPYSWSKVSNILYLDSPSGVGMSYSDNENDYSTGDRKTAIDSHTFLLKWFELYPEFLLNPFYISGESYAGVYVPTLASEVVKGLDAGSKPVLNFKGYMVGNGVTDNAYDGNALVPFAHGMALISDSLFEAVTTACNGNYWNSTNSICSELLDKVDQEVDDLNIYDILEPCFHSTEARETDHLRLPSSFKKLGETERPLAVRKRMFGRAWPFRAPVREGLVPTWPQILNGENVPCTDDEVATSWLNNKAVKKALHAKENLNWELCTDNIQYHHDLGSMIPFHKNLTTRGYRAIIFSGDHDMCVPFTGSEAWTRSLGYKIVDEWRPWFFNDQVAGYTQGYDHNLTFLTVRGSGHTVPEYKPKEALAFFTRWLAGEKI